MLFDGSVVKRILQELSILRVPVRFWADPPDLLLLYKGEVVETFIKFLGYVTISVISFFLGGFVVQQFWQWFVIPVFHLPVMTFLQGVGLCLTVRYFTHQHVISVEHEDANTTRVVGSVVFPLVALFAGWVIHICM